MRSRSAHERMQLRWSNARIGRDERHDEVVTAASTGADSERAAWSHADWLSDYHGALGDVRVVGRLATPPAPLEPLPPEFLVRLGDQLAARRYRRARRLDGIGDRRERRWLARLLDRARSGHPGLGRAGRPGPAGARDRPDGRACLERGPRGPLARWRGRRARPPASPSTFSCPHPVRAGLLAPCGSAGREHPLRPRRQAKPVGRLPPPLPYFGSPDPDLPPRRSVPLRQQAIRGTSPALPARERGLGVCERELPPASGGAVPRAAGR